VTGGGATLAALVNNAGMISVNASAKAINDTSTASATAFAIGVSQYASGTSLSTSVSATVINSSSGIISVNATAFASATTDDDASADAQATGVYQSVTGGGATLAALVNNDGLISVNASASANNDTDDATATAIAVGVSQYASGTSSTTSVSVAVINSSSGIISVNATAFASATTNIGASASATATGIYQSVTGGGATLTALVTNAGLIDVDAVAKVTGTGATADANAVGITQGAFGTASTTGIALSIANNAATGTMAFTGSIDVFASATGVGTSVQARATASGAVNQFISGMPVGSTASSLFINQGIVDVGAFASAGGGSADADAFVWGVKQLIAGAADSASVTFTNTTSGSFDVFATALAKGANASATAEAVGVWQTVSGGLSASATINNDGSFNVAAFATATGNSPFASAAVWTGVYQSVTGTGGVGSTASAAITNTSILSLNLDAFASAVGTTFANASAQITTGIFQSATGQETNTVTLNNSGAITMDATALAYNVGASGNASAYATITTGIFQFASAGGAKVSASVDIQNSGVISMSAFASATAPGSATASANIDYGIRQQASDADTATASLTNTSTGVISLSAIAFASGNDVSAQADNDTHVIEQIVTATDDKLVSSASVTNDGVISMLLSAVAFGTDGIGGVGNTASASGFASYQFQATVKDGAVSSTTFVNNGTIDIAMIMFASHASKVNASVDFDTGFDYEARADTAIANGSASVTFTNTGDIDFLGVAFASGVTNADATATMAYFFSSTADDASTASFSWTNSDTGSITLGLFATAIAVGNGVTGRADATASLSTIIEADATADKGDRASATSTIINNGFLGVDIVARAIASDEANAVASITYGFSHNAVSGDVVTSSFTNAGTIEINILAFASAESASATASFTSYVVFSSANAGDDEISASATFTNTLTGTFDVLAQATARATDGTGGSGTWAWAFATISIGISQSAYDGDDSTGTITNDGTMSFAALAWAFNATNASATASLDIGISQQVSAHNSPNWLTATATITNTGVLNFTAIARATGKNTADASVEFDNTIIYQSADGAGTATVLLDNQGAISVLVRASALATDGSAYASASIDYGISQNAFADAGTRDTATVDLTNSSSGNIDFIAIANATGFGTATTSDTANAFATVDSAFYQNADNGDVLSVTLTNDGDINIIAMANALGRDASAVASVGSDVFDQEADNDSGSAQTSSTVDLTNTGNIMVLAQAVAIGSDGASGIGRTIDAFASVSTFVSQSAEDSDAVSASFTNSSTGIIDVMAIAIASNGTDVSASASIGYGIYQTATAHGSPNSLTANVTINNAGTINFVIMARATGSNTADAYVEFDDSIIYQSADGAGVATALIDNSGTFSVLGQASALALTGDASATVEFDYPLIQQYAFADDGTQMTASATINNSGLLSLVGIANATGATKATASASLTAYGFYQSATADGTASVAFNNSSTGTVNIQLMAHASGTNAYAQAEITKTAIYQTAYTSGDTSATALIDNDGTMSFLAQATAAGTDGTGGLGNTVDAYASISQGIRQFAYNALTGTATINNDGHLSFTVLANATNAIDAWASAYMAYGISQTAEGTSATGSSATATITNTSLTSLDITIAAHASGVTTASALAYLNNTFIYQTVESAEVASAVFDNSGAINVNISAMATAAGNGTTGFAYAYAFEDYGVFQWANADEGDQLSADVSFNNSGTISFLLTANAVGTTSVTATADFNHTVFFQGAFGGDDVSVTFTNTGDIDIISHATASGGRNVDALAYQNQASTPNSFHQQATAGDDQNSATATFVNGGDILLLAIATAIGSASATSAFASGAIFQVIVEQHADGALDSTVTFENNGSLDAIGMALASNASFAEAYVEMESGIVYQSANGLTGTAANGGASIVTLTNTSNLSLNYEGYAQAFGITSALATVTFEATYIYQEASANETATVSINNSGTMSLIGHATASAVGDGTSGYAFATAILNIGIFQSADAGDGGMLLASANLTNSGTIFMELSASAVGTTEATAHAHLNTAIWQEVGNGATISVAVNNSGSISFLANANAVGGTFASAQATATRIWQTVNPSSTGTSATMTFSNSNSGSFLASANAMASNTGGAVATAFASAAGVNQNNGNPGTQPLTNNNFSNDGSFTVSAFASANAATTAAAFATAVGYNLSNNTNTTPILNVSNGGTFQVNATAVGLTATATALGMVFNGGSLAGSVSNSGTMNVTASASGGNALAIAVQFNSPVNNTTFTNTGTIAVLAIGSTTATAIQYNSLSGHTQTATASDLAVFTNNGGTLWAGVQNGTLDFGTVINTTNAPHPVLINLQGATQQGNIWGNILLSPDDNILVTNGNTIFRGMINGTATFVGSMTISAGGTLTLATTGTGPSVAYVDNYTQTSSGTLAVNIFPSSGTNSLGQINALTASLAGTIQVNVVAGLYANSQTYQDVVVATTLTGTWDTFVINTNTPFLSVIPIYPGDDTADLSLVRNAFTSVGGMTLNQMAAASGIENSYSTSLTGPYAAMISQMFTFGSSTFISAVEQLHGADYAQNMMTNLGSMAPLNYSIDDRLNAGPIASNNRQGTTLIQKGDVAIWARAQIVWGEADGDIEAPGYDQTQKVFYAGLDYAVNDDILIGFVAGYYDNELRFNNGNRKDDDGVQIGLYGEYDTQKFYIRGIGGYASYNADSVRHINFGSTVGTNFGNYDSTVTSFMIETGRRFEISQDFYFTPYGGLSYAKVKTDAFTETGLAASALAASSNSAKSFMSDLGARFTAAWDTGSNSKVIIEFGGAWQHEFKNDPLRFTTSFAGASGSAFTVIGSVIDPDTFMLNAGVSLATGGGFEIKASYWGRFNSNFQEHSAGLKVIRRF
ncbi:MAG: hypothetical protein IH995_07635, partial [Proteobacteria bacterium]|nr:hypothetical protein [Pseudomonadota bacterium]